MDEEPFSPSSSAGWPEPRHLDPEVACSSLQLVCFLLSASQEMVWFVILLEQSKTKSFKGG